MAPLTNLTTALATDILLDTGVLYINSATPFAASAGDLDFDAGVEFQNLGLEADGVFYPVLNHDRNIGGVPKITGSIIQLATTKMDELLPGSTSVADYPAAGDTSFTAKAAGNLFVDADYIQNVRAVWRRGNGGFVIVKFAWGLCTKFGIKGQKKGNGSVPIEIEARSPVADVAAGIAPWQIYFTNTVGGP